ncbi:glycine decarboxylase subunit P, partial [Cryomyces antarcticus]
TIAHRVIAAARVVEEGVRRLGYSTGKGDDSRVLFDTVLVEADAKQITDWAVKNKQINLRIFDEKHVGITVDETVNTEDIEDILDVFAHFKGDRSFSVDEVAKDIGVTASSAPSDIPPALKRTSQFLTHPVFNSHHSETELLRYIHHLQSKDLSLTHSMIPLGSCTMKLNSTTEMVPISWPEFSSIHPFVPTHQAKGYTTLINELEKDLAEITGFHAVSLQPNSGAQGEFTGLRIIRKYLEEQPGKKRDICLIPVSAHGTNPASAAMAGMRVVTIKCENGTGNLDMEDLKTKCEKYSEELGAIMITYPSTFGIFEPKVKEACELVHKHGGQVYMDGANMNAQIGLCSPGEIGADVCHLNLHKTFCIPHGGGGPGVGPI